MELLLLVVLATLATLARIWALIGLAILTGWGLAFLSVRNRAFETIYVPITQALEAIPVIGFLPIVLVIFVTNVGGALGTELAVDFLVFDAVAWNIWIGAYQSFKTIPGNLEEVSANYSLGWFGTFWKLQVPHSIPRISSNLFSSFSDAFFYISVSEVFTIGIHSYSAFGIGTLIAQYVLAANSTGLIASLAAIAVAVVGFTLLLNYVSRRAIARYGLDNRADITRRPPGGATPRARWVNAFGAPRRRFSRYLSRSAQARDQPGASPRPRLARRAAWWAIWAGLIAFAAYILYASYQIVVSQSAAEWGTLLSSTPYLLLAMGVDYLRVGLVTLASVGLAFTLGFYIATHKRANLIASPIIQTIAAYPVPTYFPLVFGATIGFLSAAMPWGYAEVYIFILAFLSCFYYVFFDFWIGVLAIPSEFWEVMDNYELGYWSRLRRVVIPASFPYLVTGLSSTVNSCWAGLAIGEFWPDIWGGHSLIAHIGMMKYIGSNLAVGNIPAAAWVSCLFAVVVILYGLLFTRNLMDLARKRYVVEEGVYAA